MAQADTWVIQQLSCFSTLPTLWAGLVECATALPVRRVRILDRFSWVLSPLSTRSTMPKGRPCACNHRARSSLVEGPRISQCP